jgi:hypothetical protein
MALYNYTLTRLACGAVFKMAFAAGTCIGGAGGVLLGLVEHSAVGVFGGAFLGLAFGLLAGACAAAAAAVFNQLAPVLGGIAVRLDPVPAAPAAPGEQPGDPAGDTPGG